MQELLKDHPQDQLATVLASIDAVLLCGVGPKAASRADLQALWPDMKNVKWLHSCSAGLDSLLWPDLVESPVVVTNARVRWSLDMQG